MALVKKHQVSYGDKWIIFLCAISALLLVIECLPFIPTRVAQQNMYFGAGGRFAPQRSWSYFAVTDNQQTAMSWMMMKENVCTKALQWTQPNPLAMVMSLGAQLLNTTSALSCGMWTPCKTHALNRCNRYQTIAYTGLACIVISLICLPLLFSIPVFLYMERRLANAKKKKKVEQLASAKFNTMSIMLCTGFVSLLPLPIYIFVTGSIISGFQRESYYPWVGASVGCFIGYARMLITSVLIPFIGVMRWLCLSGPKDEEETPTDDYQDVGADIHADLAGSGGLPGRHAGLPGGYAGLPGQK